MVCCVAWVCRNVVHRAAGRIAASFRRNADGAFRMLLCRLSIAHPGAGRKDSTGSSVCAHVLDMPVRDVTCDSGGMARSLANEQRVVRAGCWCTRQRRWAITHARGVSTRGSEHVGAAELSAVAACIKYQQLVV